MTMGKGNSLKAWIEPYGSGKKYCKIITNSHCELPLNGQWNCIAKFFTKHRANLPLIWGRSVWRVGIEFHH